MMIILILLLIALGFVVWPAFSGRNEKISQEAENLRLYNQRKDDIMSSNYSTDEQEQMLLELDYELISNDADAQGLKDASPIQKIMTAFVLFSGIAFSVVYLYSERGAQDELLATQLLNKMSKEELTLEERQTLRESLKSAAEKKPKNLEWQYIQGRMLFSEQRYADSIKAFEKIYAALPEEAKGDRAAALFQIGQAHFYIADQKSTEKVYDYLKRSLAIEPSNGQVLGLAGITAFELNHLEEALTHWKGLWFNMIDSPSGSSQLGPLKDGILRLTSLLEAQGKEVDLSWMVLAENTVPSEIKEPSDNAVPAEITVLVTVSNELKAQLQDGDVVFVMAKAIDGPPMPLAAVKILAGSLPQEIILDDSLGMMSGLSLSQYETVDVIARVSKGGKPMASSGDLQGSVKSVSVKGNQKINVVIDHIVE